MLHQSPSIRVCADDQVATLWLDRRGPLPNALCHDFLAELDDALAVIENRPGLDVLVVRGRSDGFSAGLDPDELARMGSPADWTGLAEHGQRVIGRLANLSQRLPTVAYLDGPCLGAGLELALACSWRLAVGRPDTRIGFAPADAGLCPAWGGTVRLPRLVGPAAAVPILMGGQPLSARAAADIGLVDRAFSPRQAKVQLWLYCQSLQLKPRHPADGPRAWPARWWSWVPGHDAAAFRTGRETADTPAKLAAVEAAEAGWRHGPADGLAEERRRFAVLGPMAGPAARLQAKSSGLRAVPAGVRTPPPARLVGVVGNGDLATDIAFRVASRGGDVVCWVPPGPAGERLRGRLTARFSEAVAAGWLSPLEGETLAAKARVTDDPAGLIDADLILEAADAPAVARSSLLADAASVAKPSAVLAAVNPAEPLESLAWRLPRPARVAALLAWPGTVELSRRVDADADVTAVLAGWLGRIGADWLPVGPRGPGVTARATAAYQDETRRLLTEGHPAASLAGEARRHGLPTPEIDVPTHANDWPAGAGVVGERLMAAVAESAAASAADGTAPEAVRALLAASGLWPAHRGCPLEYAAALADAPAHVRGPHLSPVPVPRLAG